MFANRFQSIRKCFENCIVRPAISLSSFSWKAYGLSVHGLPEFDLFSSMLCSFFGSDIAVKEESILTGHAPRFHDHFQVRASGKFRKLLLLENVRTVPDGPVKVDIQVFVQVKINPDICSQYQESDHEKRRPLLADR